MPDAPLIVLAILITLGSGAALLLGIAFSAAEMWREYHRKRDLIELDPSRTRLGIDKRDRRR